MSSPAAVAAESDQPVQAIPHIKEEPLDESSSSKTDDVEQIATPWQFLTNPPDKETINQTQSENPDTLLVTQIKDEPMETSTSAEDDKTLDTDAKTFIDALDHLDTPKPEQDAYFYGEQMLFAENALLDVASEETVTPEGITFKSFENHAKFCSTFWAIVQFYMYLHNPRVRNYKQETQEAVVQLWHGADDGEQEVEKTTTTDKNSWWGFLCHGLDTR